MSIFLGAVKTEKKPLSTYVFSVYDNSDYYGSGPKLVATEIFKRSSFNSAKAFVLDKWKKKKAGFSWSIEPFGGYTTLAQEREFYERNPELDRRKIKR